MSGRRRKPRRPGCRADEPLLIPGLELVSPPAALSQIVRTAAARGKAETEQDRLRGLLAEVLTELEALRALLG